MKQTALRKAARVTRAQQLLAVALFTSGTVQAVEMSLDVGAGFGSDDNVFYAHQNEERESFGVVDIDFEYDNDLSDNLELEIDAVYEDKYFDTASEARDKFFSGFTQLVYKADGYRTGIQFDPQYRQFVVGETDGLLTIGQKQRVTTLKARGFVEYELNDDHSIEAGYERKSKDYRDSDSDYDANIYDLRLRSSLTDTVRLLLGVEREERNYDDRLAVTALGADVPGKKLDIDRTTWFIKGTWRPTRNQKYSLQYKHRKNEDDFQEYYGHDKDQVTIRAEYEWENGVVVETKLKFSDKSYDEQLDDEGRSLDSDKSGVDVELSVPLSLWFGNEWDSWYTRLVYEWDDNDSDRDDRDYDKNAYWLTIHRVFN